MCTVDIKIDEAMMRRIDPALNTRDSIAQWLQQRVDEMMEEFVSDSFLMADNSGRIMLTAEMKEAVSNAEQALEAGSCLSESAFKERIARWL